MMRTGSGERSSKKHRARQTRSRRTPTTSTRTAPRSRWRPTLMFSRKKRTRMMLVLLRTMMT